MIAERRADPPPLIRTDALTAALAAERARLVRFCARHCGDRDTAEDLAQETLARAWALRDRLHDTDGLVPWLSAIARNVCLHWARARGRDLAHRAPLAYPSETAEAADVMLDDLPGAADEPGITLERGELADLLDRALALLPGATRRLLLESYVYERPQSDLAARLGMSEGALRVRLHRGRLALRRVLAGELHDESVALGLALPASPEWQESRIWCPFCGRRRLLMRIDRATGAYAFRCAGTCQPQVSVVGSACNPALLAQVSSPKSILARHCLFLAGEYRRMIRAGSDTCGRCGREVAIQRWQDGDPPFPFRQGIYAICSACGPLDSASAWHLTLDTPEAILFWRRNPRIRALPVTEIELAGRPALVTGYESLESAARLEIVSARDTWETLRVAGDVAGAAAGGVAGGAT